MSTITRVPTTPATSRGPSVSPSLPPNSPPPSRLYRLSVWQYDRMVQEELLDKRDRVELIEGLLVVKMSKNPPHVVADKKGLRALERIIPQGWHVAKEDPIVVSDWSEPEPDLAVVRGRAEDYLQRQVTAADVALVVEIAQSSLSTDRSEMGRVYAASSIPFYWIVNLVDGQIEVYTGPGPAGYQARQDLKPGQDVAVVVDGVEVGRIPVTEILPGGQAALSSR
jgi:Uma2 family endonuclease